MLFYYLEGTVAHLAAGLAVLDCGGVGYGCSVTGYTQGQLQMGRRHRLYTHCSIREDAIDIYGFATQEERSCFERLLTVSGVGPKAALAILSVTTPDRFALAVASGDEKALTAAPGVGRKLAQRILLELKDKIAGEQLAAGSGLPSAAPEGAGPVAEAAAALAALGYSQAEIGAAMRGLQPEGLSAEEIVRACLRAMVLK